MTTKERILDAAERLFADEGYAATSLRDITKEADVNLAAVHYHFGSKIELLKAVLSRRFEPVNEERLRRLTEVEERSGERIPGLEDVLRAFIEPIFLRLQEDGGGWAKFMQLVGRTHSDTSAEIRAAFEHQFEEVVIRFSAALARALPELSMNVLGHRTHFVVGAMAHTFAFCNQRSFPLVDSSTEPAAILEALLDFAAGGLRAPVSSAMNSKEGVAQS